MLSVLRVRAYRHLFFAQVTALLGTGLATMALSLLAFDKAGMSAGQVLGTVLAIKMLAYVLIAPLATAVFDGFSRRFLLVSLDVIRVLAAVLLLFVAETWQIYVVIAILQSASAAFTPLFQSTVPELLPNEDDYTKALSLSRLAYDIENLVSPILAATLLLIVSGQALFLGTALGFAASALLVVSVALPNSSRSTDRQKISKRLTKGFTIFRFTPRLQSLVALNVLVSLAGAMVIVNTVVWVQGVMNLGEQSTALAFAAFGGGSMLAALLIPKAIRRWSDRSVMLVGGALLSVGLVAALMTDQFLYLLVVWFWLGLGYSTVQTPTGRLLTRSAVTDDRPALFAAQFSLSHTGWLVAYPLVGWLGAWAGLQMTLIVLIVLVLCCLGCAIYLWPVNDSPSLAHTQFNLSKDHPHIADTGHRHSHHFVIDHLHQTWPNNTD